MEKLTISDTLDIPSICFTATGALHNNFYTYLNCEKVCDGYEVCYYSNGNKQLEGIFTDGKPDELT
ncbi:MAG: hypothetical protein AAF740_13470, partial [Bacteroidota bacterium]